MADGTNENQFKALEDGTYESTVKDGSLTIVTSYDDNFEITGTDVQKAYDSVQVFDDMSVKFKAAWGQATNYLPSSWTGGAVQFAAEGDQTLVIATADDTSSDAAFLNGDVIGRITSWDGSGTWQRWFGDSEVDVESSDWSYNYHLEDWTYFANAGGREVKLANLTNANGVAVADQPDEAGEHVSGVIHKSSTPDADWTALQGGLGVTADMLTRLGTSWDAVNYVQVGEDTWSSVANDYRSADDLWSDSEERVELHGIKSADPDNTVFLGSVVKRDGFIVLRDEQWNELARLIDPNASSADTTYEAMSQKLGDTFSDMWTKLDAVLPTSLSNPEDLLYVEDQHSDILVFNASGEMVARLNHWNHSNTWERSWDSDYPTQTWTNNNFEVQVREASDGGNGHWVSLGRYEAGQSDLTSADGVTSTEHSWERTSSTLYERNSETADWAALEADYFSSTVANSLDDITSWGDVDRIESSQNNSVYYPVAWRDQIETEESTEVRYYSETAEDGGNWYRQEFLGSMEKRDGFIEIRDDNWETVARVVDISDASNLKDWDFITNQYQGIEEAWGNAVLFFPKVATVSGSDTTWGDNPLKTPDSLLFTTDDNNIYAFTAAGAMAGQINYWVNEDEWERFYDDQLVTVKNIHFNYNFHDENWNQVANSGGNQRYVVDPDTGAEILDEVGKNIGFMQIKDDVDPTLWATYDPNDSSGTIDFSNVSEIRYETRSWESVTNKFRESDDNWSDSNVQIQYYEEEAGQDWAEFVGSVEQRDGFIELRDENWNIISKKVDPTSGETFAQMVTRYGPDFTSAWDELEQSLPADWVGNDANNPTYESFTFTTDKWDNILIFDSSGEMIGQINYWSHIDQWSRSWDEEYPTQIHTNKNFNFQGMDTDASTGNWNWISIGEYQVGKDELVKPDGTTTVLERSWENVGQTMFARLSDGDSDTGAWNTTIKDSYFTDAVSSNLTGITGWGDVDRIEVSDNTYTHEAVGWRDTVDVEESVQVRFYEEVSMDNGNWYHTNFLGSMEKRDGFIEVRDENWETVARIADLNGSQMKTWEELQNATDADGNLLYPEINTAWTAVEDFFPKVATYGSEIDDNSQDDQNVQDIEEGESSLLSNDELEQSLPNEILKDPSDYAAYVAASVSEGTNTDGDAAAWNANPLKTPGELRFTTDEQHIYAFTSTGEMVGQINFWNGEDEFDRFFHYDDPNNAGTTIEALKTVKSVNYNYNFHDADWNSVANSGGNARYIVEGTGDSATLILDEVGKNIGFMQHVNDVDPTLWTTYDPADTSGTIDFSKVSEIRYETNSWQSVSSGNPYRDSGDDWSDSTVRIEYYETVEGQNWTQFVGSKEERDGFIEIRDEHWNVVATKVDASASQSYSEILTEFGADLDNAWTALSSNLPADLQDTSGLKFTKDQWDNILIFSDSGEMIGQINYWSHIDEYDRSWDAEYPKEINSHKNFHFQGVETQSDGNYHFVSIGDYGVGATQLIDAGGSEVADRSSINIGSTMFERSSPDTWDTTVKNSYFVDAVADNLASVNSWDDVDRIEVSESTHSYSDEPNWRSQAETETSLQVRFYEEVQMDGGWYHNKFLGIMEKRDGFIEIRDENWDTVSRVVDPDSATDFTAIAAKYQYLDWAWTEVATYLPTEAADPSALSFTEDDHALYAFDDQGNMVVQINVYSWTHDFTDSQSILREEVSYDYNFRDADFNEFASARKSQEFVSDTTQSDNAARTDQLDREHTEGSFRVKKKDVSDTEWAALNPNDKTGTIIWDDVDEVSLGIRSWGTVENFNRAADNTYTDTEERVEYFELVENQWGDSFPDRLGVIETQGSLQRVYDKHWELVGSQTDGDIPAVSLLSVISDSDVELLTQFRTIMDKYIDLDTAEFINGAAAGDPGLLVQDGQIMASIYYNEDISNGGMRLNWDYDIKDLNNNHILDMGGWNALAIADDPDSALAKPNGVDLREYFYKDELSNEEWNALEQEASFTFSGFDWGDVGVLTKKVYLSDYNDQGFYDTRTKYQFVKVDAMSGRQDWNYFQKEIEGDGLPKIQDGNGNLLGYDYPPGSAPVSLVDEMGQGFKPLLDALEAHLQTVSFINTDIPDFNAGAFTVLADAATWTSSDSASPLSLFGDFDFDATTNNWGDREFELEFDREDGNPLVKLKGWVRTDSNGDPNYDYAEIRIKEYVYKTDLDSDANPKAENTEWATVMTEFGPSVALKAQMGDIWDGTAPDVELVEIEKKFKYQDGKLKDFNPANDSVNYFPDEVEVQFMEGTIDSTSDLDIEWTGDQDYRIEYSGGVATLKQDNTVIAMELDTQTTTLGTTTPTEFVSHTNLFPDTATGQKVMAAVDTLFGSKLAAEITGYSEATLKFSGDNVLLVASDNSIVARGELNTDLTPDGWGTIDFSVRFEDDDGHNSIGFSAYSAVNTDGTMDFTNYGITLHEYLYKSKMSDTDWATVKSSYGPTSDLPISAWDTDVELVELSTRHRDLSEAADASALNPGFYRTEARFVEGNFDATSNDLNLNWNWSNDDRIEFQGGLEIHKQGNNTIDTAILRDFTEADVTDLGSEFISGFADLVASTGIISGIFDPSTGDTIKVGGTGDNRSLYVYDDEGGQEELVAVIERASWADDYADTAEGYELRSSHDGASFGWLFKSTPRDVIDLAENTYSNVVSEASSLNLSKENNDLPLEAWKYLNDTFTVPDAFDFDFYDISQVRILQEDVVDYSGSSSVVVNETIFLQFDLPDQSNAARIGYDITNNKFIAYDTGEFPDPTDADYVTAMAAHAARATDVTSVVAADVKAKISDIIDALYGGLDLADDFYQPSVVPPDANFDISVDAVKLKAAADALKGDIPETGGTAAEPVATSALLIADSGDTTDFTMSVFNDTNTHTVEITSDISGFGTILETYASTDTTLVIEDLIYDPQEFVEDALEGSALLNNNVAYDLLYTFNAEQVISASMEDAEGLVDWQPISDGDMDHGGGPTETLTITVVGGKYAINGNVVETQGFTLTAGTTYVFDESDSSNVGHPLSLSTTEDNSGGVPYTQGVQFGQNGVLQSITVAADTPDLFIYCQNHTGMGGALTVQANSGSSGIGSVSDSYNQDGMSDSYNQDGMSDSDGQDGMGDGPPSPEDAFIMAQGSGSNVGEVYLYTPDDQVAFTLTGISDLAAVKIAADSSLTTEVAFKQVIDDLMMDFLGDDDPAPHNDVT